MSVGGILGLFGRSRSEGTKQFAVLLDPDTEHSTEFLRSCHDVNVDYFFVGGSLLVSSKPDALIKRLKAEGDIPIVIFPGSVAQIHPEADAFLLLSLISGRNADLLIGKHVEAAPMLKGSGLEIIPTGYILIDGGKPTTASYISNTTPIPADKPEIAACTALAGEMLGLKIIFLDAGSGATQPVSPEMVMAVRHEVDLPVIVGGGIDTPEKAFEAASSGADIVVVGNAFEHDPALLPEMVAATRAASVHTKVKN